MAYRSAFVLAATLMLPVTLAALQLPEVLSSNMVLQRAPTAAAVWGWATPQATVTVTVDGADAKHATAGSDGSWSVSLTPRQAGGPHTISFSDGTSSTTLTNVLFGDVFLCSGQSNMAFTVSQGFNASDEIAAAGNYPDVRVFTVLQNTSYTPLNNVGTQAPYQWGVASPATVGGQDWQYVSAACWFHARDTYLALKAATGATVPIGAISSTWGGTLIEAWSSPQALSKCNNTGLVENSNIGGAPMSDDFAPRGDDFAGPDPNTPSVLWNAMIVPLLPMRLSGVLWYQGEANAGDPLGYACRFPAMISDWRAHFQTEFPFEFVLLAPWMQQDGADGSYPAIRQAQMAALALDGVGMAVATDRGQPTGPFGSIHPQDKQAVGARLSLVTQSLVYDLPVQYSGAVIDSHSLTNEGHVWYYQINLSPALSLEFQGSEFCEVCCLQPPFLMYDTGTSQWVSSQGYNMTMNDPAESPTLTVWAALLGPASGLRYAWWDYPQCFLYNDAGLPMAPWEI